MKPFTRRGVLSTINSLFDPIGFVAPVTIEGKLFLRDIIKCTKDWDEPLPDKHQETWQQWRRSLKKLENIQIPRTYLPTSFSHAPNRQLHVFSDASEKAIGAVAYLTSSTDNTQEIGFVMGKAKVAPTHGTTIPRLELCAAVMATEMAETICDELGMEIRNVHFYTDSKVVLGYIRNTTRRFYVYVTNRVQRIRKLSTPKQWDYVSTDKNPADVATRGVTAEAIMNSIWIKGPSQLHAPETTNTFPLVNQEKDKELRPEVVVAKTNIEITSFSTRFENISEWKSLVRTVTTLKRFVKCWIAKRESKIKQEYTKITAKEYQESEIVIIQNVQKEVFSSEIESLETRKQVPKASKIASLNPFIDNQGLLRVGGRIRRSDLTMNEKHPIIIPGTHHIAKLLVCHIHENVKHQGRHFTEGGIRSAGYWITGGKRLIGSMLHHCITCKRLRGKTEYQQMSDLPIDRVTPSPPFSFVGVDTFGPWTISTKRTRGGVANSKRWAIMFSCLTSRGIHIELVEEMSASSFINALRRFVALRGPVTEFRSDRGTNFVGAADEMKFNVVNVEDNSINQFLLKNGTTWKFNSPHSSHMAGSWERMIGIARRILNAMLMNENRLTHEILSTLMAEVCAIVNGRPIVAVSTDPEAPSILSPSTLITQKSSIDSVEYLENVDILYRKELLETKQELEAITLEIDSLLQRQASLQHRKTELEAILRQSSSKNDKDDEKWEKEEFPWNQELKNKMASEFKIDSLRPMQLQTMNVTMSGKDCMLIMPTGGGKSLCFQLPALLSKGVTLVVSPLVSLMQDQIMALEKLGIDATNLDASASKEKVKSVQDAMLDKKATLKLLYVTPEKLAKSKRFMAKLEKMYQLGRFARLVIDEVHCCSQWGHDFRPDYKFLGIMKRQFPEVPILGLTATATTKVLEDVKKILSIPNCHLFKASFNRPNLYYEVRNKPGAFKDSVDEMVELVNKRFKNQSGIIYCFTQKESEEVTTELRQRGIKAGCYHANIPPKQKSQIHEMWLSNKILIIVATVAFGMGIDKPDVRFVIHHSISKSMENLYQESGRAGRDNLRSDCIVFFRFADVFKQSTMVFTEQTGLDNVYGVMTYCLDVSKCRRATIARHFGELWEKSQCNKMCDHCSREMEAEKRDVTKLGKDLLQVLNQAAATEQRVTALKLLDAWQGKGQSSLKVRGLDPPNISREKMERIVGHMLLQGYIREDFHFTPYSTISYIVAGPKANLLQSGAAKLGVEFPCKRQSQSSTNSQTQSASTASDKPLSNSSLNGPETKPKLVVINSEHSKFTNTGMGAGKLGCNSECKAKIKRTNSLKLKRKKPVIEDSDSEDLDFGQTFTGKPAIKKRTSDQRSSQGQDLAHDHVVANGDNVEHSGNESDVIIGKSETDGQTKAIMIDSDSE